MARNLGFFLRLRLQDLTGQGHDALLQARTRLLDAAKASPVIDYLMEDGPADAPQINVSIDREKAEALGVSFDVISSALASALGSEQINEFANQGCMQRVIVQADGSSRQTPEALLRLQVPNRQNRRVPLQAFSRFEWLVGPLQIARYNGSASLRFSGDAAPGYSTGQAMEELKNIARQLSAGFSLEWAGLSLREQQASDQMPLLVGLSLVVVLLVLVASYESWTIPFAVLLIVPVGMFGAVATVTIMGMPNDVYFKVGLITIIGLSAKNAILRCRQPTGNQYRLDRWHACGNTARCLVGTGVLCLGSVHGESLANAPRPVNRNNNREG